MTTGQKTAVFIGAGLGFVALMLAIALPVRWSGLDCGTLIFRNVSDLRGQGQEADEKLRNADRQGAQGQGQLAALKREQISLLEQQSALFEHSAEECSAQLSDRSVLLAIVLLVGLVGGVVGYRLFAEEEDLADSEMA